MRFGTYRYFSHKLLCALQGNREAAERMLTHGEQLLAEWKHPDPLVREYSPLETAEACRSETVSSIIGLLQSMHGQRAATDAAEPTPHSSSSGSSRVQQQQ